ncbi:MAG TPA: dynamin family protein [Syntrophorhabdaceae bacterium]|nr:dynamin family protein [Syntrophorhabdaceae bacterium]HOG39969.1 dynamin family protein [Syntrophorhabdaceae bacterium]
MKYQKQSGVNLSTGQETIRQILENIRKVSANFHIVTLNRQIEVCEGLFTENPLIDVAILGQFKAGKSSFINSIIGKPVLPVGVIPVTTVITRLQYGQQEGATVKFFDGKTINIGIDEVEEYISEAKNTANQKNVEVVDIELPSLGEYAGLRLVDTPGLGSIFKYNTEISEEWLPEVGAAIIAISSDRPLSENDLYLIRELMEFTPKVAILLTKVDLLSEEQQREVVKFFKDSLKREFNMDFQILLYSTVSETELYKRWLDKLLSSLSMNRDSEFKGILQHKVRSLARQCISYLDIALKTSTKADVEREALKKTIIDEKVNYELIQSELSLIARENKLHTRELISSYLNDTHRSKLIQKLIAKLSEDMTHWKGNLWRLTRQYEDWLMENMTAEMDHISRADYKNFFGTLKKAHSSISRSVELFRNLLDRNIENVLGIKPNSVNWVVEVSEPAHPDVVFTKTFDFHFDLLWFLIPMFIFRRTFEKHYLKQIPRVTDIHLSRLAYQWEVRINNTIDEIKEQALEYVLNELTTIDALLSQAGGQTEEIKKAKDGLAEQLERLNQ